MVEESLEEGEEVGGDLRVEEAVLWAVAQTRIMTSQAEEELVG